MSAALTTSSLTKLSGANLPPTLAAKVTEMIARRSRASLTDFAEAALAPLGFAPAFHHRLLISKLEAVARGEIRRLMIFMPPGAAKSTYASVLFPAWYFAQRPNRSGSHASD